MSLDSGGGGSSLGDYLKGAFLTAQNTIRWGDLGGAVVGGLMYQVFNGVIALPIAIGEAIAALINPITGAYDAGVETLGQTIVGVSSRAWDPIEAGLFGLPINAAVVLLAMFIAALALGVVRQ